MSVLEKSAYLSLFLQFITGLVDIWGINLKVPESFNIFRQLLVIELVVQIIEFVFYVWMVFQFNRKSSKIKNITVYRYFDWFITTPSMLLTLMAYLSFDAKANQTSVVQFIKENYKVIFIVFALNAAMLFTGLVGELGWMNPRSSALIGFFPFVLYFYIIYKYFVKDKQLSNEKRNVFFYFLMVWSLYGVAALLPYEAKNTMYNILDLFAKNFFGLFLVYILYQESLSNKIVFI